MGKKRLIIIGLDGATHSLLRPWAEKGYLPTLKKFFEGGTHGNLESTIPPLTGPAWIAMATGKDTWKMGIYNFLNRTDSSYREKVVNSSYMKGRSFWDYISMAGKKVGIFSYPMLYPAYEINGFMVSGFGGEDGGRWTYPREVSDEIREASPGYMIQLPSRKYNSEEEFISDVEQVFRSHKKAATHLLAKRDPDLFMFVLSMPDWLQHHLWHHLDPSHPAHDAEKSPKILPRIISVYREMDRFIGELASENPESNFILVSDHGFGSRTASFDLAAWLHSKGYLEFKKKNGLVDRAKSSSYGLVRKVARLIRLKQLFPGILPVASEFRRRLSPLVSSIDFERSRAFSLKTKCEGAEIYINLAGRDEQGIVKPEEYAALKEGMISEIRKLPEEFDGISKVTIYGLEDAGIDTSKSYGPDIFFSINNWDCNIINSSSRQPKENIFRKEVSPAYPEFRGTHRMEGIFMAYGPDIKEGIKLEGARIIDIMPTVLAMFGIGAPPGTDGKVLQVFRSGSELSGAALTPPARSIPGKEKLEALKKQLKKPN